MLIKAGYPNILHAYNFLRSHFRFSTSVMLEAMN